MGSHIPVSCLGHPEVSGQGRGAPEPRTGTWRSNGHNTDPRWRWWPAVCRQQWAAKISHRNWHTWWGNQKVLMVTCRHWCLAEEEKCFRHFPVLMEYLFIEGGTCWKPLKGNNNLNKTFIGWASASVIQSTSDMGKGLNHEHGKFEEIWHRAHKHRSDWVQVSGLRRSPQQEPSHHKPLQHAK